MAEKCVELDCFSFKAVLQGFCKDKSKTEAEKLLKEMNGKGLAIGDNCDQLRYDEGYKILRDKAGVGFSSTFATYNIIVLAYCNVGMVDKALETLSGMAEKGMEPDCLSFKEILQGF
ncbi:pentatricopeptide repeat-containing protein At5g39710-like [Lotus japonicus]|uniref:pentatricopeptide repeat-containing protein At5g39710-like n=1 Tax=Lotus japonicus TaxID=34305 RepID=UPI002584C603|nr:pentatricopeptide repeat-containing protein At5g39710-like [Lotus japonicus]